MEFLRSFLRRHFAGKLVVASRNVGCFLRLYINLNQPDCGYLKETSRKKWNYCSNARISYVAKDEDIEPHLTLFAA